MKYSLKRQLNPEPSTDQLQPWESSQNKLEADSNGEEIFASQIPSDFNDRAIFRGTRP